MKFTEEYLMWTAKHVWVKNLYTKLNMGFPLQKKKRQSMQLKHINSLVKKKVPGIAVCKDGHADSLIGPEGTYDLISFKKM